MTLTAPARTEAADAVLAAVPDGLLIGGSWTPGGGSGRIEVTDPATGDVLAAIADATPADALAALEAADSAAASWAATAPRARSEILRRAFELVTEHRDELALLITLEMGKPLAESRGEVAYGAEFLRWFAEEAVRIRGTAGSNPEGTGQVLVSHDPVGPCYLITPWNFPLAMATRKIAPALAAGCTVVIKPSELTPLTTLRFAALLQEAGVPAGVVNVVTTTDAAGITAALLADPRLKKLSFTGSTAVGRRLIAQAAQHVLRVSMELGGNAPFLVLDDADLDAAVAGAMLAKFRNIGQACTAANRFLVHESLVEGFTGRLTERIRALRLGPGTEEGVGIGPLINDAAVTKALALVDDAVARGATLVTGGRRGEGLFLEPTVLTGVRPGSAILREEIFGPVVAIVPVHDEDEAVRLANDTEYGLVAYAYTRDLARAHRLIRRLQTGMVGINTGVVSNAAAPFGGVKESGFGREGGAEGILEYLTTKYSLIPDSTAPALPASK
ncbi:NAD-dependent succinate-semialdehyde dehydrogenase [Amnibacterium sp. CER49]|uniref:NAD-dependent succinate-semialdehyde dehydrogenase n=1 Tax=Amnibacterium sp. CER49 TaxID=3039161 RepID=UPI0024470F9E|nr:NAD-dependent succinate-semialdehyde dehydrogenase [Amnibacterium sp. CER49]MDH2445182.1 NAD-dependent succinate-semialdehyde dehydrogenase [Amnibacterium sp. CER49]